MATINFFDILAIEPNFFDEADIDARIDKKKLGDSILRRCGTLQPVYTDSRMFKFLSNTFFYEKHDTIRKLLDTVDVDYNPIDNYDRTESVVKSTILTAGIGTVETNKLGSEITETNTLGTKTSEKREMGSGNSVTTTPNTMQEEQISAYDNTSYVPKSKMINSGNEVKVTTQNGTDTFNTERSGEDVTETVRSGEDVTETVRSGEDKTDETIETRTHGNIGVTTTQEMLKQERKVALFNIYNWIAIEFEQNFFICVS